jgi:DnaJ-class molecular chaperone
MRGGGSKQDFYQALGLGRDADEKAIKTAFRRLARKYHPDVNPGDKAAEQKFKEISEAYEVLRDPKKRAQYDQFGHLGEGWQRASTGAPGGWTGTTAGPDFDFSGFGGNLNDLFEQIMGGRGGRGGFGGGGRARRGQDVRAEIELTLEDAYHGATREFTLPVAHLCPTCGGAGIIGQGAVCAQCGGAGQVEQMRRLQVTIPVGVKTGAKIRLKGQGEPGPSGKPGDLYLITQLRPHRLFQRDGDNLQIEVPVTFAEAALGGEIDVPTMGGKVTMRLPAGSSSGRKLRLTGRGMPRMKGGGFGDLFVQIKVVVPKDPTPEERELITKLEQLRQEHPRANLRV